jgi:hypothetical protein
MPSVHVAWAVLIAIAVVRVSTSPRRWWIVVHPIVTIWAVTVTANHFYLDGVVAVAVLLLVMRAQTVVANARRRPAERVLVRDAVAA